MRGSRRELLLRGRFARSVVVDAPAPVFLDERRGAGRGAWGGQADRRTCVADPDCGDTRRTMRRRVPRTHVLRRPRLAVPRYAFAKKVAFEPSAQVAAQSGTGRRVIVSDD